MAGKARERRGSPSMLDSPALETRLKAGEGHDLLDEADESGFMGLNSNDFARMNLVDTPPVQRISKPTAHLSSPGKKGAARRPSWGPRPSPSKGKMRLLEGVEEPVQARRKERTLGGLGDKGGTLRPRQSIFAKPAFLQNREREGEKAGEEDGDDSLYKEPALSSSTGNVQDRVAAIEASRLQQSAAHLSNERETKEQTDSQLAELRKMNSVFEAYERMLSGSADQIETFAQRIAETNSLLDIYIDLMRQADRTQQLLLDGDWKGATEDESAHALALELAEREKRRKMEEAEHAARLVARRKQEAEQARKEAEQAGQAEQRRTTSLSARGGRGGSAVGRGGTPSTRGRGAAPSTTTRVPSATRGRATASATASTRGAATTARGSSTSGGLNNRYASVRSSGYGPPK